MDLSESRDRATIRALRQIDVDLAGLFEWGRELCGQPDRPGLAYLIGHVGRELTNCLVDQLEEERIDKTEALETTPGSKEEYRYRLASALGLSPNHEVVRRWFKVHQVLQAAAHARVPGPKLDPLRRAFADLADLLYGRVGDYFQTQAEIDALADSPDPAAIDIDRLHRLLLRPVQRHRFFSRIHGSEWLEPLARARLFRNPPGRKTFADGSWRPRAWPEGDYLVRMAATDPARVVEVLSAIPDTHENPIVWSRIADAIKVLPTTEAAQLALKLARALQLPFSSNFAHHAIEATTALVRRGQPEAFRLTEALLWLSALPAIPERGADETTQVYLATLRNRRRQFLWKDVWLLARVDDFELDRLIDHVFPALRELDARRLLDLLVARADHASKLVPRAQAAFSNVIRRVKVEDQVSGEEGEARLDDIDFKDIGSLHWCKHLERTGDGRSIRAHLTVEAYKTAQHLAKAGTPVSDIVERLEVRRNEIVTRMVYALIAESPKLDLALQTRVDAFVISDDAIWPPFGTTETAALLRAHFTDASPKAQQIFRDTLERGPGDESIARTLEFSGRKDTPEERDQIVADWQRRQLRRFHDEIPPLLQPLAGRLGIRAAKPTDRQQSLDETGSWSSGVSSGGARSPTSSEDLAAMSPREFAEYLITWQPADASAEPWNAPSEEGLQRAVTTLAATAPDTVAAFLPAVVNAEIPLPYVTAILHGLRSALQQKKKVRAALILSLAEHAWRRAERIEPTTKAERQAAEWAADAVSDLLKQYIESARPRVPTRVKLWSMLATLAQSPLAWRNDPDAALPVTYAEAWTASFTRTSGRLTDAIFALAWRDFMASYAGEKWPPPLRTGTADVAIPILEPILERYGPSAFAAQGVFGQHLEQLLWFAHEWTVAHLYGLLDRGSEDPGTRPAWSVYVGSAHLSPPIFQHLRPWYVHHAASLPPDASDPVQDPGSYLAENFAVHIIVACAVGVCAPGDADALVENTFNRVPVQARNHAYWAVFRSWTDAKTIPGKHSRNVIAFWESRLRALESVVPSEARDEELDGLCWFIATPHLPSADIIRLGQRTTKMLGRDGRVASGAWEQLAELATKDAGGVFIIVEQLVDRSLKGDFPYVSFDDVAPPLRSAIAAGGELRDRALALVHRLGGAGFEEFGVLWQEAQGSD